MFAKMMSLESPIIRLLTRLTDLVLLNVLFILTSLPLVTIGASLTSLYACCQRLLRGQGGQLTLTYFQTFRQNFKQATTLFIPLILLLAVFSLDGILMWQQTAVIKVIGLGILAPFCGAWLLLLTLGFSYLGRYADSLRQTIKNVFLLALNNFLKAILLVLVNGGLIYLALSTPDRLLTAIYFCTFGGFALVALLNSLLIKKIFDWGDQQNTKGVKQA
ncbi:YesL family protein [Enterococcus nangangensis]|uniref:YesL family protein n=1 Tax=Enterococcus nangangensis TaxID=2559926 RepID=UPI0010F76195|nr:YesL family protein [Enterococcus nangangensis]